MAVIPAKCSESDLTVKVCTHVLRCFAAAAQFPECRERMALLPAIAQDVCRGMWLDGAPTLTLAAIEAAAAFAVDEQLQDQLLRSGALWHLLLRLFKYVLGFYVCVCVFVCVVTDF